MSEPIDNHYFNWLCTKAYNIHERSPQLQFKNLLRELHHIEFVWLILGDDNRAEDGRDLREEFLRDARIEPSDNWLNESCSVLEMLMAFSRHAGFQTDRHPREWFWEMLDNLGLAECNDSKRHNSSFIQDTIERFVWRTYEFNGRGGLFPLENAAVDQRTIEIWYQFSAYAIEQQYA